MLNDIENKVLGLHEKFKEKFGVNKYENLVGANLYFNNIYEKSIVSSLNINGKNEQITTNGTNLIGLDNNQYKVDLKIGDKICVTNNGTTQLNLNLYTNYGDTARNDYFTIYANSKRIVSVLKNAKAIAWGGTIEGLVWVNKGEEQLPYEEYTGGQSSPNPDYPQAIKSVSGVENLFDKDNANILNAYFDTSTTSITYSDANRTLYIPCKENTTYTISKYLTRVFNIGYTTSIPVSGVSVNGVLLGTTGTYDGTKTSMQITTGTNAKYLVVRFIQTALDTVITEQQVLDSIMIEKGSIVHDYVPYGHWLKVKNTGKNLFNGILKIGSLDNTTGTYITDNKTIMGEQYIKVLPNTQYAISTDRTYSIFCHFYDNNQTQISYNSVQKTPKIITTPERCYYVRLRTRQAENITNIDSKIQFEKGKEVTSYEPYQEQSMLIDMSKPNLFDKNNVANTNSIGTNDTKRLLSSAIKVSSCVTVDIESLPSDIYWSVQEYNKEDVSGNSNGTLWSQSLSSVVINSASYPYIRLYFKKGSAGTSNITPDDISNVKINVYEGVKDYYELCSIGDAKDELNIDKDGNVSVTKNIDEVVLNGSENWFKSGGTTSTKFVAALDITNIMKTKTHKSLCNYFNFTTSGTNIGSFTLYNINTDNTIKNIAFGIDINEVPDLTTWKTWLSNNPVTVQYILDEPQVISLGKITSLNLLKGLNNITINDELQPNMTSSINCLNLVETSLRNIKVNDYLNNKTIHLSFPFESYENITSELLFVSLDDGKFLCRKVSSGGNQYIGYKYNRHYNYLYYKYTNKKNIFYNYIRYKLPNDYGKVSSINENDIFYKFVKIKDDEYKLQEYNKKTWVDNEIPYLQYIDNIEEGINNVAEILYKPSGYEYKEWTTTGYYGIKSNDYGLAQKPISSKDFDRWNKNIKLLNSIINNVINIWNLVSFIDWNEESQFEWEEN